MPDRDTSFVPLLVVIALAFLVPLLLSRLRRLFIPVVVGEIVAGMLVGGSGLGLVEENAVLTVLADLGFVFLMFLSGLEISFSGAGGHGGAPTRAPRRMLANPLVLGGVLFGAALVLSGGAALYLRAADLVTDPWITALILSTTSLGVVVPVLKERGLTGSGYGQAILVAALVADFATILLISVYVLVRSRGLSADLILVLVLFAVFLAVYRVAGFFRTHLPARELFERLSSATSQLKLRGAFALVLTFVALSASLGIEDILGAFLAGVVVSLLSGSGQSDLREKLDAVGYSFFIPIFFVMVGVRFELGALLHSGEALALVPLLLGIAYGVKLLPALLFAPTYGWRRALAAGTLLSSRLSLIIAAAAIGLELGLISESVNSAVILVAVITCTLSPILFGRLAPVSAGPAGVLIAGGGTFGRQLAERLRRDGDLVVVVERDPALTARLRAEDLSVVEGDATDAAVLACAGIRDVRTVVATTRSDETNLRVSELAREEFGREQVVARISDQAQEPRFGRLGVRTMTPSAATAMILTNLVRRPEIFGLLSSVAGDGEADIIELRVSNPRLDGVALKDLGLPGDSLLLLIRHEGERVIPRGTTRLSLGDRVTIAGSPAAIRAAGAVLTGKAVT